MYIYVCVYTHTHICIYACVHLYACTRLPRVYYLCLTSVLALFERFKGTILSSLDGTTVQMTIKKPFPYLFCRSMFPSAVVWGFFVICKILPQFGTYKYMCPRVSLSGNCTNLSSGEISSSTCSCCPAWPPLPQPPQPPGCPAAATPSLTGQG